MGQKREIPLPHLDILDREADAVRPCSVPGCRNPAECKAPLSPDRLYEYQWFCREHARLFNEAWNFFDGKTAAEIEAHIRSDTIGQRPTRSYALPPGLERVWRSKILHEFAQDGDAGAGDSPFGPRPERMPKDVRDALAVFGYTEFPERDVLRRRYHELVKLHHPDHHAGSPHAEDAIKRINQAWHILKTYEK